MVVRLLRQWRELAGATRDYPQRDELDPRAVGDPWPSCFVLDLTEDRGDPRIEYLGEALAALGGAIDVGTPSSAIAPESLLAHATSRFAAAASLQVPIVFGGEFRNGGNQPLLFRGILAPLGTEPEGVTHLLGAASARVGPLS